MRVHLAQCLPYLVCDWLHRGMPDLATLLASFAVLSGLSDLVYVTLLVSLRARSFRNLPLSSWCGSLVRMSGRRVGAREQREELGGGARHPESYAELPGREAGQGTTTGDAQGQAKATEWQASRQAGNQPCSACLPRGISPGHFTSRPVQMAATGRGAQEGQAGGGIPPQLMPAAICASASCSRPVFAFLRFFLADLPITGTSTKAGTRTQPTHKPAPSRGKRFPASYHQPFPPRRSIPHPSGISRSLRNSIILN